MQTTTSTYITGSISLIFPDAIFMIRYAGSATQIPFAILFAKIVKVTQINAGTYSVMSE